MQNISFLWEHFLIGLTITGNTKYDETYVEVSEEEKQQLRHEFHFDEKGL
mgnify:CR=1 FL=1